MQIFLNILLVTKLAVNSHPDRTPIVMIKLIKTVKTVQELTSVSISGSLKGRFIEVNMKEKKTDLDSGLNKYSKEELANHEAELQMLDKMRNQLLVWDM